MKPYVKPRKLKRKPRTQVPKFDEWKREWEFTSSNPVPMGNPYSTQPLEYARRKRLFLASGRGGMKEYLETQPFAMKGGDVMPHVSKRQATRFLGKGVARLHPIGMAISIADDVKTLYDILK